MESNTNYEDVQNIINIFERLGVEAKIIDDKENIIIGIVGNINAIDIESINSNLSIKEIVPISEPFKKANRLLHPKDTIVKVGNLEIGGNKIIVIAGPCSVENEEQIIDIAQKVKESGASLIRGGAFKPRTSPYSFQGLQEDGLELLQDAKIKTNLGIVSELMSVDMLDKFVEEVDIIQIGARNMQNYELLKAVGKTKKPILLKRGFAATIEEWLMSAEYIMAGGNDNVILCERGIRTFETSTRNTLDISAIPVVKKLSHLPIIVDPSHAGGEWWMVESLSKAAVAAGADGLIIEVHNKPQEALSDGEQSLKPERFDALMVSLRAIAKAIGREI